MPFFGQTIPGPTPPFATQEDEEKPKQPEPVELKDGVFEEFPFGQKRHYNNAANQQEALGPGMTITGQEKQQFDHLARQNGGLAPSEEWQVDPREKDVQPMSSYQAQCQGGGRDDVGTVKTFKPGKKILQPGHLQGHNSNPVLPSGALPSRNSLGMNDPAAIGSLRGEAGHIPGYSGHVSQAAAATGQVTPREHDKSLPLLSQNYHTNLPGYTGVKK